MMWEVKLPQLGSSMVDAEIVKWLKNEGDNVEEGEPLVEIDTAKAVTTLPCPKGGVLKQIITKEGSVVKVGEIIALIDTA